MPDSQWPASAPDPSPCCCAASGATAPSSRPAVDAPRRVTVTTCRCKRQSVQGNQDTGSADCYTKHVFAFLMDFALRTKHPRPHLGAVGRLDGQDVVPDALADVAGAAAADRRRRDPGGAPQLGVGPPHLRQCRSAPLLWPKRGLLSGFGDFSVSETRHGIRSWFRPQKCALSTPM